jgi:hypothetical protein
VRELLHKRGENVKVFVDDDGNEITSLYPGITHYQDEGNNWSEVDNFIYENTGSKPQVYKYATKANSFIVGFKDRADAVKFVDFKHGRGAKGSVSYTLNGLFYYDPDTQNKVQIHSANPSIPVVDKNVITYPDVFNGVDLEFVVSETRLKETFIFESGFKNWLPDPVMLGFDPTTAKVLVSMTIHSKHGSQKTDKVGLKGSDGMVYNWLAPATAKSATNYNMPTTEVFNEQSGEYLYGINYRGTQLASYPIQLDPTLYIDRSFQDEGYLHRSSSYNTQYQAVSGTALTYSYAGVYYSDDGKGNTAYDVCREFSRWYITAYEHATIYGTVQVSYKPSTIGARTLSLEEIEDWYSLNTGFISDTNDDAYKDWNRPVFNVLTNNLPQSYGSYSGVNCKDALIVAKKRIAPAPEASTERIFAVRVRANDENVASGATQGSYSVFYASGTNAPKLDFSSYTTFTQNSLTAGNGQVTVNWTNGGGLVSGDKHRIYYRPGTGYTAQQIIDNNTYVESSAYNDTSKVVTGLTNDTTYSFVVVDMQNVGGTFYAGARSSIQTATPVSAGGVYVVSITCDTRRNIGVNQAPVGDTKRKTAIRTSVAGDTKRGIVKVISVVADTIRRSVCFVTVNSDTLRKTSKLVSVLGDTYRQVTAIYSTIVNLDTLRKVIVTAATSADTNRKVARSETATADTFRKVTNAISVISDAYRVVRKSVSVQADTLRQVVSQQTVIFNADTVRKVVKTVSVTGDTKRKVTNAISIIGDTLRQVVNQSTTVVHLDTVRKVVKSVSVNSDTRRKPTVLTNFVADSRRKVTNSVSIVTDTYRKVIKTVTVQADTQRRLAKIVSLVADTRRQVVYRFSHTFQVDTLRKVVRSESVQGDTYRKTRKNVSVTADTRRNASVFVYLLADTRRIVTDFVTSLFKKDTGYYVRQTGFKYGIKEYKPMGKTFRVGEEKEIGVEITSKDDSSFGISQAIYEYRDSEGNVLAQGDASVDGHYVYVLLKPTVEGYSHSIEFSFRSTPLDSNGNPDLSKNSEVHKPLIENIIVKP